MAYPNNRTKKRADTGPDEVKALREAIAQDHLAPLYVFHGEETYLRDHCLAQMKELLCGGLPEMNFDVLDGKAATPEAIREAVETYPAFGGRRMVLVRDCDILRATGAMQEMAKSLFCDLPESAVLIFSYDTIEYKTPDKELAKLVSAHGKIVNFRRAELPALENWVMGHFRALGKVCERAEASFLIYRCGGLMTELLPEIEKVGHFAAGERVTRADIEALTAQSAEAATFDLTDAVSARQTARALRVLSDLLAAGEDPIGLINLLAKHLRQLYAACILRASGGNEENLTELAGVSHPYVAKKLFSAARNTDLAHAREACIAVAEADRALKSSAGEKRRILEMLLFRIIGTED